MLLNMGHMLESALMHIQGSISWVCKALLWRKRVLFWGEVYLRFPNSSGGKFYHPLIRNFTRLYGSGTFEGRDPLDLPYGFLWFPSTFP